MNPKRPIGPRTPPTGLPGGRTRRAPSAKADTVENVDEVTLVKRCYCFHRERWQSQKANAHQDYKPPRRYDGRAAITVEDEQVLDQARPNEWSKLLSHCRKHQLNPITFIAFVFDLVPITSNRAPEPWQICTQQTLSVWQAENHKITERLQTALEIQRNLAEAEIVSLQEEGMSAANSYSNAILNHGIELSPLFRYCLALSIAKERPPLKKRFLGIAQYYEAEAILQAGDYLDDYCKTWAGILPRGFRVRAAKIYPHLLVG